jgi:hypothetical protein
LFDEKWSPKNLVADDKEITRNADSVLPTAPQRSSLVNMLAFIYELLPVVRINKTNDKQEFIFLTNLLFIFTACPE